MTEKVHNRYYSADNIWNDCKSRRLEVYKNICIEPEETFPVTHYQTDDTISTKPKVPLNASLRRSPQISSFELYQLPDQRSILSISSSSLPEINSELEIQFTDAGIPKSLSCSDIELHTVTPPDTPSLPKSQSYPTTTKSKKKLGCVVM